jgi:hypothetical protein
MRRECPNLKSQARSYLDESSLSNLFHRVRKCHGSRITERSIARKANYLCGGVGVKHLQNIE